MARIVLEMAIQRFIDTHKNKNRNNDPILQTHLHELDGEEFKQYVNRTEEWVKEQR